MKLLTATDLEDLSVAKLKAIGVILHRKIKVLKQEIADLDAQVLETQKQIPNMTHPDAPVTFRRNR